MINSGDYSKLGKLFAITTYAIRFIHNFKSTTTKQDGPLTSDKLYNAKMLWIKDCQAEAFWKELVNLNFQSPTKG